MMGHKIALKLLKVVTGMVVKCEWLRSGGAQMMYAGCASVKLSPTLAEQAFVQVPLISKLVLVLYLLPAYVYCRGFRS